MDSVPETGESPISLDSPTARVHLTYDISNPPPVPGPEWTRFVCISDTHAHTFPVPPGDVLLHSGDLTGTGTFQEFSKTVAWLRGMPHGRKIIIAGNHDLSLDDHGNWYDRNWHHWHANTGKQDGNEIRELLVGSESKDAGLIYLQDEIHEFQAKENGKTWTVYGSPWSPWFYDWAFNYNRETEAENLISAIPKTDILLTHGPPFQMFDRVTDGTRVGCEVLAARLLELRPRLHVFGHIHEDHGADISEWPSTSPETRPEDDIPSGSSDNKRDRTVFVNAANWPQGPKAWASNTRRHPFGGGAFAPVIVDLLDTA